MTTYTERVCVLYLAKEEQHTISSTGSVYTSSVDNDVKITFPEGAVSENKDIDIQVRTNKSCINERLYFNFQNKIGVRPQTY